MIENKLVITVECNRCGNQAETKTVAAVVVAAVVEELLAGARLSAVEARWPRANRQ